MRRLLLPVVMAGVFLSLASGTFGATPQRDTWNISYSMSDCGFAVDVHDYGWNAYNQVSEDGWAWAKTWHGTLDYTNPANDLTATKTWDWRTTQTVLTQTASDISLQILTQGSVRVSGPTGVAAFNAGQMAMQSDLTWDGTTWNTVSTELLWWHGPHPMDLTNAFCDAMTELLNP